MTDKKGQNIAYIRVSTVELSEERQRESLEKYDINKWFVDKVSNKNTNRPQLQAMLDCAKKGDNIYIYDFSRLASNLKDLIKLTELIEEKRINLISIKENLDTSTPTGELMITMIGAINEFERANLLERQREGIAIAKILGKYKGRKKIDFPSNWKEVYFKYKRRELTAVKAMEELGLKKNTFYKLVKEFEEEELCFL